MVPEAVAEPARLVAMTRRPPLSPARAGGGLSRVRTWAPVRPVEPPDPAMTFADHVQAGSAAEASAALYWGPL
jgi:hypothetical protein